MNMAKYKNKSKSNVASDKVKELKSLINKKKSLEVKLKKSKETIEYILTKKITDNSLNKLPIESLKELYVRQDSATYLLNEHSTERKNQLMYIEEISKLESRIQEVKIEMTIEKINNLLKDLN